MNSLVTGHIRRKGGGNVFTAVCLSICPHEGTPASSPRFLLKASGPMSFLVVPQPLVPCPFWVYPSLWSNILSGSTPASGATGLIPPLCMVLGYLRPLGQAVDRRTFLLIYFSSFRASFLQKNAALVEIAWPTRGWHFFYADPGKRKLIIDFHNTKQKMS